MDIDTNSLGVAFDLDFGNACGIEGFEKVFSYLIIGNERITEGSFVCIPARFPIFNYTDSQTGRIDFLSHCLFPPSELLFFPENEGDV